MFSRYLGLSIDSFTPSARLSHRQAILSMDTCRVPRVLVLFVLFTLSFFDVFLISTLLLTSMAPQSTFARLFTPHHPWSPPRPPRPLPRSRPGLRLCRGRGSRATWSGCSLCRGISSVGSDLFRWHHLYSDLAAWLDSAVAHDFRLVGRVRGGALGSRIVLVSWEI